MPRLRTSARAELDSSNASAPPSSLASESPALPAHSRTPLWSVSLGANDQLAVLDCRRLDLELVAFLCGLAQALGEEAELLLLRLVELHAEHPVDAALQVEAEPQPLVGQQRARGRAPTPARNSRT